MNPSSNAIQTLPRALTIEVCVDSVESALAAEEGGADRIELCQALSEGGLTPSAGLLQAVKAQLRLPVAVMVRPRGGDFLYTAREFDVMERDLEWAKQSGANMIVTGVLCANGRVDRERTGALVKRAAPLPVTFHRAFDMTRDPAEALEDLVALGVERVLTSGQENSVPEGLATLARLHGLAQGRIVIMPGGGITELNVTLILDAFPAREIHCSASTVVESAMGWRNPRVAMGRRTGPPEYAVSRTSAERLRRIRESSALRGAESRASL